MPNYTKTCPFLHAHYTATKKVAGKFVKKNCFMLKNTHLLNGHMLWVHIGIASMRRFQCVPTKYVTENKKTNFEIYTKQVSCPLVFLF